MTQKMRQGMVVPVIEKMKFRLPVLDLLDWNSWLNGSWSNWMEPWSIAWCCSHRRLVQGGRGLGENCSNGGGIGVIGDLGVNLVMVVGALE